MEIAILGAGCFWGPEIKFSKLNGVKKTEVGYCGGNSSKTSYREVCTGETNHAEVVLIVFNPKIVSFKKVLNIFFISHDATQINRQGNDIGTQYRSIILVNGQKELDQTKKILQDVQKKFYEHNLNEIATEIKILNQFYYAEDYHQQYLVRNPNGYCNLKSLNICLDAE